MSALPCDREGPWHSKPTQERSPIYALPALGEDRGELECLTSYLQRLSFKHNLFCGDFVNHILLPRISPRIKASNLRLCKVSHSFNGSGVYASAFEQALSDIWPKPTLSKPTTFTFLTPILGDMPRRLVSEYLQWCPVCLREQQEDHYFPLYWQCTLSKGCTKHQSKLINRCHNCGKGIRQIVSIGYPGICPYCGVNLKEATTAQVTLDKLYESEQIRLLIQHRKRMEKSSVNLNWMNFINTLATKSGNISKLEANLGLCDTQLSQWKRRSRPELSGILKLSKALNLNALDILADSNNEIGLFDNIARLPAIKSEACHKRSKLEVEHIAVLIRKSIDKGQSTSLKSAAKNAGVSVGFIAYHYPAMARELKEIASKTALKLKRQLALNLQKEINREVLSYYENNHRLPSVNQLKDILRDTPGNSTISIAHLLAAKKFLKLHLTQSLERFPYSLMGDHNHESNNRGDS